MKGNLRLTGGAAGERERRVDGDLDVTGSLQRSGSWSVLGYAHLQGGETGISIVGSMLVQGSVAGRTAVGGDVSLLYSSSVMRRIGELTGYEVSSWIDQ